MNLNLGKFGGSALLFALCGKHVCLSYVVLMTGAAWRAVMRIEAGVGDVVQRTGNGQAQVEYLVVERSRGRVMLCVVCTVHNETRSAGFLVWPQNQGRRVSWFGPQNRQLQFGDLAHKIVMTVSWFGPQN
jgi:hypothetical protein